MQERYYNAELLCEEVDVSLPEGIEGTVKIKRRV
jgi:hypothetical protein